MTDAGKITAIIDGDISGLTNALNQAKGQATTAVSGIEGSFKGGLKAGLADVTSGMAASLGPIGSAMTALGPAGVAAGAGIAAIGGALYSSVQAAASFETSMSGVAKTTGLTGPELSALGDQILQMSSTMPVAASELAAIAQVAGSLGVAKEELAGFSEVAAQMSVAFEMPAEQAATSAAKILTAFGMDIDTSNMKSLGNVVNTMGDSFAATEPEVLDFINRASFLNTTMGQSIPQVAALGTALISAGMSSETASTGIKSFLNMATSQTANKDNLTAWADMLGTSVDGLKEKLATDLNGTLAETAQQIAAIEDPTERFQAAVKLAGTEGAPAILKLAAAGDTLQDALSKANSEWENGSSMMKTFEQNSSTLNAEWDTFTNTLTRAGIELGNVLLPTITGIVSAMNDWGIAAIEAGEATYEWASSAGASIKNAFAASDKWLNDTFGFYEAGEAAGEEMADAIEDSPELQDAPGKALSSADAQNEIKKAADEAGETYADRFSALVKSGISKEIAGWMATGAGISDLDALALINSQTRRNGDDRNEVGRTKTTLANGLEVEVKYQTDDGLTTSWLYVNGQEKGGPVHGWGIANTLPELLKDYDYDQGNVFDLTNNPGEAAIWRLNQDVVLDSFLDVAENTKNEIEAAGELIATAFTAGMVPDKAQVEASLANLKNLQLYDPEEAKAQGSQNAILYLTALKDAIESYDEAKAKYLVEPDNERALADLERSRANLQAQLDANPLQAKIETQWGQFDTKSFADLMGLGPEAMKNAAVDIDKFFDGTIVPGIRSGMEAARAAFDQGQIGQEQVYDNLIKPLEQYADYLPGWLEEMNSMFKNGQIGIEDYIWLLDQMTGKASDSLAKTSEAIKNQSVGWDALKDTIDECSDCAISDFARWQESQDGLFQDSYIGQGGQAYLDWKNAQIEAIAETQAAMDAVGGVVLGQRYTAEAQKITIEADTSPAEQAKTALENSIATSRPKLMLEMDTSVADTRFMNLVSTIQNTRPTFYVNVEPLLDVSGLIGMIESALRSAGL